MAAGGVHPAGAIEAMIDLHIRTDLPRLEKALLSLSRQMPFVEALTLTTAAKGAADEVREELPSIFDQPTPFTRNGVAIQPARRGAPMARVYIRQRQAEYLAPQETGGVVQPKAGRRALVVPVEIRRNQYGNMARNALKNLKGKPGVFIGTGPGGAGGFWRRREDQPPELLAAFKREATYKPVFGFKARVIKSVRSRLGPALQQAIARARATAR
ncbi:hypothetical protein HMPREF0731_4381 [Pseudoroseomonas cervicalis ATCC 49957]|uniref:Uncharacterized protein n=2 Tax=Teichococcus cervicalis TaxID=204525 RepID=D5RTG9_9PROT|nr:hypothetical protein HMPREF0731_4381 [Pseudoroseomonas cervicalis ATCC 49957]